MLIADRNGMVSAKKSAPTARDYVQNGLVAMWDGIENAGWGVHRDNIADFKELVSGNRALVGYEYGGSSVLPETPLYTIERTGVRSNLSSYQSNVGIALPLSLSGYSWEYTVEYVRNVHSRAVMGYRVRTTNAFPSSSGAGFLGLQTWSGFEDYVEYSGVWATGLAEPIGGSAVALVGTNEGRTFIVHGVGESTNSRGQFGIGNNTYFCYSSGGCDCTLNCIRVYSRTLSAAEIAANYAIDKARFNLP